MKYEELYNEVYEDYFNTVNSTYFIQNSVAPDLREEALKTQGSNGYKIDELEDEFLNHDEFAESCGVDITRREMTWEEKVQWVMKNTDVEMENLYIVEEIAKPTSPTHVIELFYKGKEVKRYE
jgi:hypothetical protein